MIISLAKFYIYFKYKIKKLYNIEFGYNQRIIG